MWWGVEAHIRGTLTLVLRVSLVLLLAIHNRGMPSVHWQHEVSVAVSLPRQNKAQHSSISLLCL